MNVRFEFDERALRRELEKQTKAAIDELARNMSRRMEQIARDYAGRPVAEIKLALQRLFSEGGGSISDPELSDFAQRIHDGNRIEFRADWSQWHR